MLDEMTSLYQRGSQMLSKWLTYLAHIIIFGLMYYFLIRDFGTSRSPLFLILGPLIYMLGISVIYLVVVVLNTYFTFIIPIGFVILVIKNIIERKVDDAMVITILFIASLLWIYYFVVGRLCKLEVSEKNNIIEFITEHFYILLWPVFLPIIFITGSISKAHYDNRMT